MIGVFDSGIGGLTYVDKLLEDFPHIDICYLADTLHTPYGGKTREEITKLMDHNMKFFYERGCPLVIIACNTAASDALRDMQSIYEGKMKILGVLIPASEKAVEVTKNKKIGVIGTKQTITSQSYDRELKKLDVNVHVESIAAPELVPMIERGERDTPEMLETIQKYMNILIPSGIDVLILGCTHYKIIKKHIASIIPKDVTIVNSSKEAVRKLPLYLEKHQDIKKEIIFGGSLELFCTGDKNQFEKNVKILFPRIIEKGAKVKEVVN